MFVIEVIPLIRDTRMDSLSYYSAIGYEIGTILSVPVRRQTIHAIVTAVHSVADSKTSLRAAAFALRRLPQQSQTSAVPQSICKTAIALTLHYPVGVGAILYQLLPPEILRGEYEFPLVSPLTHHEETTPRLITARREDRFINYRSYIRSILARRGSVMLVVPTSTVVTSAAKQLSLGIAERVVCFAAGQTKRQRQAAYQAFEDTSLAKLIITTPSHAYLDRVDLLAYVLEEEASDHYRDRDRPYLDHRTALTTHAKLTGRSLLFGDILPRAETEYARRTDAIITHGEEIKRHAFSAPLSVYVTKRRTTTPASFSLLSPELSQRIKDTLLARGHVFLYGARRGLAPVVLCSDCGYIFQCPDSGAPYSLLRTHSPQGNEERWFISTTSGKRVKAADTCPQCGSWRLREQGVGVQLIQSECEAVFAGTPTILFDHQSASTPRRASALLNKFYEAKSAIMVGTHLALPYLVDSGVELSAIVAFEAVRATPTWRVDEYSLRLLMTLRDLTKKEVIIQTKHPEDPLLLVGSSGFIENFYTDELALRESLHYPPFDQFILLSWQGTAIEVAKIENDIQTHTKEYSPVFYSHPSSLDQKTLRHGLYRIPRGNDQSRLIEILRSSPPYIKIELDPSRIV